jgi:hypothetical protein
MIELLKELDAAMVAHESARKAKVDADNSLMYAVQRLSKAQEAIDIVIAEMKEKAPYNSEWNRQKHPPERVEA